MRFVVVALLALPMLARADDCPNPPLWVAKCLPSKERCEQALQEICRWLAFCPENERLAHNYWTWERALWAVDPEWSAEERRRALRELVDWHGWRMVLSGELPDPVPLEWVVIARGY